MAGPETPLGTRQVSGNEPLREFRQAADMWLIIQRIP
jgi:hypothetical protein